MTEINGVILPDAPASELDPEPTTVLHAQQRVCHACRHSYREGANRLYDCRKNPPVVHAILAGSRIVTHTAFPQVTAIWWCGSWEPREPAAARK